MSEFSQILFVRPDFIEGVGRVFDIGNAMTRYNESATEEGADTKAMAADWLAVGSDLRGAMKTYEQESPNPKPQAV